MYISSSIYLIIIDIPLQITFKVDDIHLPEVETMFTSMKIGPKKIPVFVDVASFNDTHHYARFMGYDKPLEFQFNEIDEPNDNKSSTDKTKPTKIWYLHL